MPGFCDADMPLCLDGNMVGPDCHGLVIVRMAVVQAMVKNDERYEIRLNFGSQIPHYLIYI